MLYTIAMDDKFNVYRSEWGRTSELARALNITRAAVFQWKRVPAERVLEVERITGIPRHDLRPDIYPRNGAA